MEDVLLHIENVSKSFSGVKALDSMNLDVRRGSVHALMGENGAGKSTLMKILTGLYTRDEGVITFDGKELNTSSIQAVIRQGISMIYQEVNPIMNMTVAENIFCGKELCRIEHFLIDRRGMERQAAQLLSSMGHGYIRSDCRIGTLSVAQMQIVEIAKAISNHSQLIIMDEPTSAITEKEVEQLFRTIRDLQSSGITFIYISHKMDEIFKIADQVTVMRDGRYVGTKAIADTTADELVAMMVGRTMSEYYPKETVEIGAPMLEVVGLSSKNLLRDVSFTVHSGEILGFAGLMGAGRTEIMETLFGIRRADSGTVRIGGREVTIRDPQAAIVNGMAFLIEDRRKTGCFLDSSIYDNIMVLVWKKFVAAGGIRHSRCRKAAREQIALFSTKTTGLKQKMRELSGGNQQKVLLSRWLLKSPEILILDEPTRGIDVGAKYDIYKKMIRLVKAGKCIIMISSEMPELLGMSDRIAVVHDGRIRTILDRDRADQETILRYAAGLE
ncbi:MAG: sugar ABC transporter ATP-binding protein [Clostridium sp.]|nr:sugar ABC transporter ATP-binding protein [Clostridium sp.]